MKVYKVLAYKIILEESDLALKSLSYIYVKKMLTLEGYADAYKGQPLELITEDFDYDFVLDELQRSKEMDDYVQYVLAIKKEDIMEEVELGEVEIFASTRENLYYELLAEKELYILQRRPFLEKMLDKLMKLTGTIVQKLMKK